jgi:hypothetical protein
MHTSYIFQSTLLAYFVMAVNYARKRFMALKPGGQYYKNIFARNLLIFIIG